MKKSLLAIFMVVGLAGAFDLAPSLKVGYVNSTLEATQTGGVLSNKSTGSVNGLELGFDMNFYLGESARWGWSVGIGTEFLGVSWDKLGLYGWNSVAVDYDYTDQQYFSNDFLWTLYPNVGLFADVFKSESGSMRVKLFANVAFVSSLLFGGVYDGVKYSGGTTVEVPFVNYAFSVAPSVGARFHFAKKHGVELAFKTHLSDMEFKNDSYPSGTIKTDISRKFSVGLRYVFEWGQDW